MERAHELGYARSIGVSNFGATELQQLIVAATVAPVMNQVQFSPYEYRKALLDACQQNRVALEAYSPLRHGRHVASQTAAQIAQRSDVGKLGAGEVCAAEIGAGEIGVPKIGIAEVSPQGRVRQVGLSQRGAWGVGPLKVGSDEL